MNKCCLRCICLFFCLASILQCSDDCSFVQPYVAMRDRQAVVRIFEQNRLLLSDGRYNFVNALDHQKTSNSLFGPITFFVYHDSGITKGFVCFCSRRYGTQRLGHIHLLAVDKGCRRQGIGTKLILAALAELRRRKFAIASIFTWTSNTIARTLYEKVGFKTFGFFGPRNRTVELRKVI